jgi:outer membrane translocation and assembly module TamA
VQGGYTKMNVDFYGIGKSQADRDQSILLSQDFSFLNMQLMPKWGPVYIGPSFNFVHIINYFVIDGLGLKIQADTRDNTFYPLSGYLTNVTALFYDENYSSRRQFQLYGANHNIYNQLPNDQVLASRFNVQFAAGDVPSFFLPAFGIRGNMRGYKPGKFRDRFLWDVGTEYRHRFTSRWGAVAFVSAGDLMPSPEELSLQDLLWSGGVGLRFRIAQDNPVDFRFDLAHGDDQWLSYFSVNQAY